MRMLAIATFAAVLAGAAEAQQPIVLKLATGSPSSTTNTRELLVPWAKKVEQESGGALKIDVYADGTLSNVGDTITAVGSGIADIGWDLPLQYGAQFASLSFTALPGVYNDPVPAAAAIWRAYAKGKVATEFKEFKVIFFQTSPQSSYFLKAPPKSSADLSGLKIVIAAKPRAEYTAAMGGTPIAMALAETYGAVQKGVVDGVVSTVGAVEGRKLDELLHYYVYGPFGGGVTLMVMNKAKYDALPPALKKVIDDNSGEATSVWASKNLADYEEHTLTDKMLKVPGNKRVNLTADDLAKWQPAFDKVVKGWITSTPGGQGIIDAFNAEMAGLK